MSSGFREEDCSKVDIMTNEKAKLTFVGDLLCYNAHTRLCTNQDTGEYDFKPPIQKIIKYFQESDYVVANLETPLGRRNEKFEFAKSGFHSPPEFLEAFIDAGVDLFLTGNNHSYDQGEAGLLNTLETLDSYGVDHIGTYASAEDAEKIHIKEINGIRVAFLSYTFGINYNVHGMMLPKEKSYQINFLAPPEYHELEDWWNLAPCLLNISWPKFLLRPIIHTDVRYPFRELTAKVTSDIAKAKLQGAEFVVVIPHFGIECVTRPLRFVRKWSEMIFKAGADAIIGGHPHTLQTMEFFDVEDAFGERKKRFIIYSLGNFISHGVDYCPQKLSAMSVILNLMLERDSNSGKVMVDSVSCVPTWICHDDKEKPVSVVAIPDELESTDVSPELRENLAGVQKRIHGIITADDAEIPDVQWDFLPDGRLQHERRFIYPQDIHYLFHGFPGQVFGTMYASFCPEWLKLKIRKWRSKNVKSV